MIISVLNPKGGCGKTTLSTNLAYYLRYIRNTQTLLVDSDPQGSSRNWNEANGGKYFPVVGCDKESIGRDVVKISHSFEHTVIDGAARLNRLAASALRCTDIVLIPVQPSPYDVWGCYELIELIKQVQEVRELKAYFLLSRVIKDTKIQHLTSKALGDSGIPTLGSYTCQRVAYATGAIQGESIFNSKSKVAIEEFTKLGNEIFELTKLGVENAA